MVSIETGISLEYLDKQISKLIYQLNLLCDQKAKILRDQLEKIDKEAERLKEIKNKLGVQKTKEFLDIHKKLIPSERKRILETKGATDLSRVVEGILEKNKNVTRGELLLFRELLREIKV